MAEINKLEESDELMIDFDKLENAVAGSKGIIPVAVQNADTNEVILVAYVNDQALRKSMETRKAVFWSTSRKDRKSVV